MYASTRTAATLITLALAGTVSMGSAVVDVEDGYGYDADIPIIEAYAEPRDPDTVALLSTASLPHKAAPSFRMMDRTHDPPCAAETTRRRHARTERAEAVGVSKLLRIRLKT